MMIQVQVSWEQTQRLLYFHITTDSTRARLQQQCVATIDQSVCLSNSTETEHHRMMQGGGLEVELGVFLPPLPHYITSFFRDVFIEITF